MKNAEAAGAEMAIIYNNEDEHIPYYVGRTGLYIPTFQLKYSEAEAIKELLSDGSGEITFGEKSIYDKLGDEIGYFSSLGPVSGTYDIKPDIVAPGVDVYSTYPSFMFNHNEDYHDGDFSFHGRIPQSSC